MLTLNNKDNNFLHAHKLLAVTCVFVRVKSFCKKEKKNRIKIGLIAPFNYNADVYPSLTTQ